GATWAYTFDLLAVSTYSRRVDGSFEKVKDFEGILVSFDKDTVTTRDAQTGEETVWKRSDLALVRLKLDF
ncbi:MAG: hypothetical protein IKS07_05775, partial [Lachnospiraceae bacterium]|nr:hypothetical protein [Lachnospiraceae bacterium]